MPQIQSPKERYITPVFAKHKSLCTSKSTESTKPNNISLKSPIKLQPEMQKKLNFPKKCCIFRAFFEKVVILENGRGKH